MEEARKDSEIQVATKWECKRYPHTNRCNTKRSNGKCPGKAHGKYCSRLSTMTEPHEKQDPGFAGRESDDIADLILNHTGYVR